MKVQFKRLLALSAAPMVIGMLTAASPASAVECASAWKYTSTSVANSTKFDATASCDGVYAGTTDTYNDSVRGRFLKDGSWQFSSYGYVYVRNYNDGWDKVIGNTITGRDVKGQSLNYGQSVSYLY